MRYENWDVLLFPEGSKVPIQEFRTQCFAAKDLDSPYLHSQLLDYPASLYQQVGQGGSAQIPVLTTFIPSLARGSPFRVSVHSWERPRPTRLLESMMQPEDTVMYEVRVFIDGTCISGSFFNSRAPWPHVIDMSSQLDKNGNQDALRFPPFHEELLLHTRWDATEVYGRIRVIIAEGFTRPRRSPPFERVRDLVVFSFQHAPLHILEQSNIAWPNHGMWQQGLHPFVKYSVGPYHVAKDDEAHSHSPTRHDSQKLARHDVLVGQSSTWQYRLYPTPSMPWQPAPWPERDARWGPVPPTSDPFVEPFKAPVPVSMPMPMPVPSRRNRSTLDDVSMPDYVASTSSSSRAISSGTGSSLGQNKEPTLPAALNDEQYNQLIEALSPKKLQSGTCAPANTPTSHQPRPTKSAAGKSRAPPSPGNKSRPGPLKELSQPGSRVPSSASLTSQSSRDHTLLPVDLLTPNAHVMGRKERQCSGGNTSGGRASVSPRHLSGGKKPLDQTDHLIVPGSSESKRKRRDSSLDIITQNNREKAGASPTKKMSRFLEKEERPLESVEALLDATSMVATVGCDLDEVE
ncbi:hypothetical protein VTO42DRAFT_3690 [Malbranchea cinnamomea]